MLTINNTIDGYLKDIEIKGNTIQDINQTGDLADIRSVGDKLENQELYEIPVLSAGKNLLSSNFEIGGLSSIGALMASTTMIRTSNFIKVKNNTQYLFSNNISKVKGFLVFYYDKEKKLLYFDQTFLNNLGDKIFATPSDCMYIKIRIDNDGVIINAQLEEGEVKTEYEPYQEHKLTILSPKQLKSYNGTKDRIVCKNGVWVHEENVTYDAEGNGTILSKSIDTPLPYDQQVKLRTFANKTNIHFECEIEPTLKASVPKSLGASVSSNTEQIDILHRELDKIKKLLLQSEVVF